MEETPEVTEVTPDVPSPDGEKAVVTMAKKINLTNDFSSPDGGNASKKFLKKPFLRIFRPLAGG